MKNSTNFSYFICNFTIDLKLSELFIYFIYMPEKKNHNGNVFNRKCNFNIEMGIRPRAKTYLLVISMTIICFCCQHHYKSRTGF